MLEDVLWLCPSLLTCLLLSAVSVAAIVFLKGRLRDQSTLPPGPRRWEALCSVVKAMREENLHIQAEKWSGQYGELVLCRGGLVDFCFLNSARLVRECFGSRALDAAMNHRISSFSGGFLFDDYCDLVTSDSRKRPEWPKMRKLFHKSLKFYGDGVDRMENLLLTELQRLVTELGDTCGKDVIIGDVISSSILCVIAQLISGEQLKPWSRLCKSMKRYDDLINHMTNPGHDVTLRLFPWLRCMPMTSYKAICNDVIKARNDVFSQLFSTAKDTDACDPPRGLFEFLLHEQTTEENDWLTGEHVIGLVTDVIAASYLTSTQTLKAAFLYLTHYPEVQRHIQAEIGERAEGRQLRLKDRSDFPYTEAFILETLRFSSILPLGGPHEASDDVTVDGYTIPKGSTVCANAWIFHRSPDVFTDPDCFQPDRFLDDNGELLPPGHPARLGLLPFGVGKRSCPGESFAKSRVFLYVTTLLQNFDFLPPSDHPLLPTSRDSWTKGLILQLQPYHVILRSRSAHVH